MENISYSFQRVQAAIISASYYNGLLPTLVAITKGKSPDRILLLLKAGHHIFGENRVQEARNKWPALKQYYPDIYLHLIGPLQTNKLKIAVTLFDIIETLDRFELAYALAHEIWKQDKRIRCLVQINIGKEEKKTGIILSEANYFIRICCHKLQLSINGLMCIPPSQDNPMFYFACLYEIASRNELTVLSMGMSDNFLLAIQLGATYIRVGRALFKE